MFSNTVLKFNSTSQGYACLDILSSAYYNLLQKDIISGWGE